MICPICQVEHCGHLVKFSILTYTRFNLIRGAVAAASVCFRQLYPFLKTDPVYRYRLESAREELDKSLSYLEDICKDQRAKIEREKEK